MALSRGWWLVLAALWGLGDVSVSSCMWHFHVALPPFSKALESKSKAFKGLEVCAVGVFRAEAKKPGKSHSASSGVSRR